MFRIRAATYADLPALGRLGARLVRSHHAFDARRFIQPGDDVEAGYARFLEAQLGGARGAVLVAAGESVEVAGYVYASVEPQSWKELREEAGFIHDVVVDPSFEGQGLGAALVEAAAAWLETQDVPRIILWTAENNRSAQQLFLRLGFRRTMIEMTRERGGRRGT